MGQITEDFARQMLAHTANKQHPPLTVWEAEQLALAWLERESLRQDLERAAARLSELTQPAPQPSANDADKMLLKVHAHLQDGLRLPAMPWPDPGAHGHEAAARAIHSTFCALRFKIMDAIGALTAARAGLASLTVEQPAPLDLSPEDAEYWQKVVAAAEKGERDAFDRAILAVDALLRKRVTPQEKSQEWSRGYYCAVAVLLREQGQATTEVLSLYAQGGNPQAADPEDAALFAALGIGEGS